MLVDVPDMHTRRVCTANQNHFGPRFGHLWRTGPDVSDSWESIWTLTMKFDSDNLEFRDLKLEDGISQMVFLLEKGGKYEVTFK